MGRIGILRKLYRARVAGKANKFEGFVEDPRFKRALSELQAHGFAKIPGFFSPDACMRLREKIDLVRSHTDINDLVNKFDKQPKFGWETPDGYCVWTDRYRSDFRIIRAEKIHPEIDAYFRQPDIYAVGSSYLGCKMEPYFCMANRTEFQPENPGSGGGWHRDQAYRNGFKSLVYLSDVEPENGPFQLIPGSHKATHHIFKTPIEDKYQFSHDEVLEMTSNTADGILDLCGTAGTLLLFNTNAVHRGKPIEDGVRYAMTNYFQS